MLAFASIFPRTAYLKQVCGCVQFWTHVFLKRQKWVDPIFLVAQFWPTKRIPHMCGK